METALKAVVSDVWRERIVPEWMEANDGLWYYGLSAIDDWLALDPQGSAVEHLGSNNIVPSRTGSLGSA